VRVYITRKNRTEKQNKTKGISKHGHCLWLFPLKASLIAVNIICSQWPEGRPQPV